MNRLSYKAQQRGVIFIFLFFPVLLLATFTYYPAVTLVYNSFTSWDGISKKAWVGLENYKQLFRDPSYYSILHHNLAYLVVGFMQIIIALYFAVILNTKLRGRNFFKTILFMPYIINSIAVAFMMNYVFDNQVGAINSFLRNIGLGNVTINWLGNPKYVNYTMAFMSMWKYMGFMMLIFLGALQSISSEIYEAANIDGASSFKVFWYITLPGIWKVFQLVLFLNLSGALAAFEFAFAIYPGGSPMEMSDTFVTKTINTAFKYNDYGMASTMGIVLMVITAVLVLIQNKIFTRRED
jgi:raffinose/stachyose/melibiose transport system permease protein